MANYAKSQPRDIGGAPIVNSPAPYKNLAVYSSENATTSSVITFSDNTTAIEVAAVNGTGVIRWIASSDTQASVISAVSGANFDHVIPQNTVRRFVIPIEGAGTSSIVGANIQNGLYRRVAWKTAGVASILATEF